MTNKIETAAFHSSLIYECPLAGSDDILVSKNVLAYVTQIFIEENKSFKRYLLIVFAGSNDWRDWVDNFSFSQTKLGIHKGWYKAYREVRSQLNTILKRYPDLPVIAAGHSAGGALATIFTLLNGKNKAIELITFGSPKCLNANMVVKLKSVQRSHIRVAHPWDVVTRFPMGDFHHSGFLKEVFWLGDPHNSCNYWVSTTEKTPY